RPGAHPRRARGRREHAGRPGVLADREGAQPRRAGEPSLRHHLRGARCRPAHDQAAEDPQPAAAGGDRDAGLTRAMVAEASAGIAARDSMGAPAGPLALPEAIARWVGGLSGWSRRGLAVVMGALAALALPPVHAVPMLLIAFPVLVW